jgi:hypothetical protein
LQTDSTNNERAFHPLPSSSLGYRTGINNQRNNEREKQSNQPTRENNKWQQQSRECSFRSLQKMRLTFYEGFIK